jgi:hypothetical protein
MISPTLPPNTVVPQAAAHCGVTPDDFWAYLPTHRYINRITGDLWSASTMNSHLRRFTIALGMKPSDWLDQFRAVTQMGRHPGYPEIIEGMVAYKGQLLPGKGRIYNLYRAKGGL